MTPELPLYDERFTGYGMNKISHVIELSLLGQVTLSLDFILSSEHASSLDSVQPSKALKTLSQQYLVRLDVTMGNSFFSSAVGRTLQKLVLLAIDKHLFHEYIACVKGVNGEREGRGGEKHSASPSPPFYACYAGYEYTKSKSFDSFPPTDHPLI